MLLLAIVVLPVLLVAFIYQIVTTPVAAVDAPTLLKSGAAPAPPAAVSPTRPASRTSPREASGSLGSGGVVALAIGGLAAGICGGWLLHQPARGAIACSRQAVEVCSHGFVVLTGSQLVGGAIAVAGILVVVVAGILAAR